jgi:hypothetical protein
VKEQAMNSLIDILKEKPDQESKQILLDLALTNLQKKQTKEMTVVFMRSILSTYPPQPENFGRQGNKTQQTQTVYLQQILGTIFKRYDLVDFVIKNLESEAPSANEA